MITNATPQQLGRALARVNQRYKGNIQFARFEPRPHTVNFTLRVKSSHGPGHRRGFSGRQLACACWHAHGYFFEALLHFNPNARVISRSVGVVIDRNGGNWHDKNIGSVMNPLLFSEACDCYAYAT